MDVGDLLDGIIIGVVILGGLVWLLWTKFLNPPPAPSWKEPVPRQDPPPLREIISPSGWGDGDGDGDGD